MADDQAHDHKKRRMAIIGVSSVMLVAMVVAVTVGVRGTHHKVDSDDSSFSGSGDGNDISSSTKAVQSICQPTDYRQACEQTLAHANSSDPKELVQTAFHAAVATIEGALQNSSTIKAAENDPRTAGALDTCKEVMKYAVGDLNRSIDQIGEFELSKLDDYVENMRVWLSGAITFQETCIDAFENTTGDAGDKMKKLLNASQELTSNALAMTAELSKIVTSLNIPGVGDIGRLLSEKTGVKENIESKFPHWSDVRQRKLLAAPGSAANADVVVAKDGSGKFKTITEALKQVPATPPAAVGSSPNKTFVIYIKEGVYEEQVVVEATMSNVMFIGDGPTKTKITGNKSFAKGVVVYQTPTVAIKGANFIAKDIGFENSAGPEGHQAVALLVQSDRSIFYNCQIDGNEATLCALSHRQFYRDCTITGTRDIIFGDASAAFQNCHIIIRKPIDDQQCVVTAQGRTDVRETTGFVLQNCTVVADPAYFPLKTTNPAFLGRTAKMYSRAIVMQSFIDDSISPKGWVPLMGTYGTDTSFFSEYANRGPGATTNGRVEWAKKIGQQEVADFTPGKFLGGDQWIVPTQVPYESGMMKV